MTQRKAQQIQWELGRVAPDRPLPAGELSFVPKAIWLEDGNIVSDIWSGFRKARPGAGMLDTFVGLHDSSDEVILSFAKKWGTMFLCEHGLPYFHGSTHNVFGWGECQPVKDGKLYVESADHWRRLSAVAYAIMNIAAELNQDRRGNSDDWRIANIEYLHGADLSSDKMQNVGRERECLSHLVTDWIQIGGIGPKLQWSVDRRQWEMTLASDHGTPFGALGLKLMMAISEKDGLAVCSSCHKSYIPLRRPDPTRRNYCPQCGSRAAWRDAARERRKRLRDGGH
jgi:hypothetical protein